MFSLKKLNLNDHLTRNELTVLLFVLALTGVGIWYQIYKSITTENTSSKSLSSDSDSLIANIFSSGFEMGSRTTSLETLSTNQNLFQSTSKKFDKKQPVIVNINTASVEELTKLPGVGLKVAERIIEYRKSKGKFTSKKDLLNVKGIGEKKFEILESKITLDK